MVQAISNAAMEFYQQLWATSIGTVKLRSLQKKYLRNGLIVAIILHLLLILLYMTILWLTKEDMNDARVIYFDASMLGPPPSLTNAPPPPTLSIAMPQVAPPVAAKPVAVEDSKAPEQQTIQSQDDLAKANVAPVTSQGDGKLEIKGIPDDIIPASSEFTPYEKAPQVLAATKKNPEYPEFAKKSGQRGKVWAKVFVDKKGEVRKIEIVKAQPAGFGFEEEVKKVLPQWKFEPAIQNNAPVGVWIVIPFDFKTTE